MEVGVRSICVWVVLLGIVMECVWCLESEIKVTLNESKLVSAPGEEWVRLRFGHVHLKEARISIRSLHDGYTQLLDDVSVVQWGLTSAFFNGDTVNVSILPIGDHPEGILTVTDAQATKDEMMDYNETRYGTLCHRTDDRVPSSDNRNARFRGSGTCSTWLMDTGCFLTAQHCSPGSSLVIQFNVPPSGANPKPEDQYSVDSSSMQYGPGGTSGGDWRFFGVYANSVTGKFPNEAYGRVFRVATNPPAVGSALTVWGYGSPTTNQQKVGYGPLYSISWTGATRHRVSTTGGNSGGVIYSDVLDRAIAIHTHGGCTPSSSTSSNIGSSVGSSGLQAALNAPRGICKVLADRLREKEQHVQH